VQIHGGDSRRAHAAWRVELPPFTLDRGAVSGKTRPAKPSAIAVETGFFHLESGGFTVPKRQNNKFLDGALHFVIC
jgi:hypothetical protein